MRKTAFYICENRLFTYAKTKMHADQLSSNCAADQRLCFPYMESTIPLLPKSETSSLKLSSVVVQPGFVSDLVGNPEDRFSYNEAHMLKAQGVP